MNIRTYVLSIFIFSTLFSYNARSENYVDHRGHNVDSLEVVVSEWTAPRIAQASDEELVSLVHNWHDLMLGYSSINLERSLYYGKRIFQICTEKGWKVMGWASAKVIGQYFWAKERYDSAAYYYNRAIRTIESLEVGAVDAEHLTPIKQFDIDNGLSSMYGTIGNLYSIQDSIDLAMEYYQKAGEIFRKNNWPSSLAVLHYNMGETWIEAGELTKAKESYSEGLAYAQEAQDSLWIAGNTVGLGRVEMQLGHLRKAINLLDKAGEYYLSHDDQEFRSLLDTMDYTNQVLRLQKRDARRGLIASICALALLILCAVVFYFQHKTRRQKAQTEAVLEETITELTPAKKNPAIELNERERQILKLVAQGLTVKEISEKVFLSPETIKWYRKKLLSKFGTSSFIVAISEAKKMGLLE